jgi:hypothetical protein
MRKQGPWCLTAERHPTSAAASCEVRIIRRSTIWIVLKGHGGDRNAELCRREGIAQKELQLVEDELEAGKKRPPGGDEFQTAASDEVHALEMNPGVKR